VHSSVSFALPAEQLCQVQQQGQRYSGLVMQVVLELQSWNQQQDSVNCLQWQPKDVS